MREWLGEDFDPNAFDAEPLKADGAALAKGCARKTSAKKLRPADTRPSPEGYSESETDCLAEPQLWVESTLSGPSRSAQ